MAIISRYASLPALEISIYFIIWLGCLLYSSYTVHLFGEKVKPELSGSLDRGLRFLNLQKDNNDLEWHLWTKYYGLVLPYLLIHLVGALLMRSFSETALLLWYTAMGIGFILNFAGLSVLLIFIAILLLFYTLMLFKSQIILWAVSLMVIFAIENGGLLLFLDIDESLLYFTHVALAWLILRCLSATLDNLANNEKKLASDSFIEYLAYCFYLPVCFYGPIILYNEFKASILKPSESWTLKGAISVTLSIIRYSFWWICTEVALHFFYIGLLQQLPSTVSKMEDWQLCGFGYLMGQFFMNKYVVIYGLSATCARIDNIKAPRPPKCICRIHLYSDMWRFFDEGLYLFIRRYIYTPCLGKSSGLLRKLFASFICFIFVYIYHNTYDFVLVWTVLNFIGVTIEGLCKKISQIPAYQQWEANLLSPENIRRFHAFISVPLFMMSCVSFYYFVGGIEMGNLYFRRLLFGNIQVRAYLWLICYCGCQISIELKNWDLLRETSHDERKFEFQLKTS